MQPKDSQKTLLFLLLILTIAMCGCARSNPAANGKLLNPFQESGQKLRTDRMSAIALLVDEDCLLSGHTVEGVLPQHGGGVWTQSLATVSPEQMRLFTESPCILGISEQRQAWTQAVDAVLRDGDPMINSQTHLASIHATQSYGTLFDRDWGIHGDTVVAVVDTGLDLDHQDIRANLWMNEREAFGVEGVDDDGNGFVDDIHGYNFSSQIGDPTHQTVNDHGTHVAGLIGAVQSNGLGVSGVMGKKIKIMALNVFGKNWSASTEDIDNAIRYAAKMGATVINVSIGGAGVSDTTAAAIVAALNQGSLVVVSAGNTGQDISKEFYFPASYASRYPGLISVGASNVLTREKCDFSNHGIGAVKIFAPGCDSGAPRGGLLSTRKGNEYGYKKGTSMAAPLVAGALALAWSFLRERVIERDGVSMSLERFEELFIKSSPASDVLSLWVRDGRSLDLLSMATALDALYPIRK